jgi:putative OPT family oligopeptide transporter
MSTTPSAAARELTARAIVLAVLLAMILAAANTYLGLFAGMTIASAIPAAVVSMAVLRVLGGGGILENNIVMTGGSAGSSLASGVIFTIPALVILGYWTEFDFWWVLAIAGLGGVLGVLFSVPLRRSLIVDQGLAFPEGKAAAEVLKTGENPGQGVRVLAGAAAGGGIVKLAAASGLRLIPDTAAGATFAGPAVAYFGINLSPALLGVGYIVGLNIGIVVLSGGILSWNIGIPIYSTYFLEGNAALSQAAAGLDAEALANMLWSRQIRYLGVGAMLVGGLWALVSLRKSLLSGIRSGLAATRSAAAGTSIARTEQDLPMKAVLIGIVLFTLPLWILYQNIVGSVAVSLPMTIIMVVAGFLFCSVSAYMAGLVGTSNNPVSGITIATILFAAAVLLLLMGPNAALGPVAAIMIGAVVCCAACISGDNLQDLKAGYIIGATPRRQQLMLAIGAAASALVMAPVLNLLAKAYGIGVPTEALPNPLIAPQATLMASVSKGLFGGSLPWTTVGIGTLVGVGIIVIDEILKNRGARFRVPVLAAAVGIYLPLDLTVPIFLGGLLAWFCERTLGAGATRGVAPSREEAERLGRRGMLFAAGVITGEALMGIFIAMPIVGTGRADALALPEGWRVGEMPAGEWIGLAVLAALAFWLYRTATSRGAREASASVRS